jgi:hypothetical protein
VQSSTSGKNRQNILRIVVCPLFQSPAAVANTIPNNGTCYNTFYAWFGKEKETGRLFAVEFNLAPTSPVPFNVQFFSYDVEDDEQKDFSTTVTPVSVDVINDYIQYGANWS